MKPRPSIEMNTVTAYQARVKPSSPYRAAIVVGSTSSNTPSENENTSENRVSPAPRIAELKTTAIASNRQYTATNRNR